MNMRELHTIAKSRGVRPDHMYKIELIRSIQIAEKNFDCFATAKEGRCDQSDCRWREDCFESATHS
jgi:hypothetical protein